MQTSSRLQRPVLCKERGCRTASKQSHSDTLCKTGGIALYALPRLSCRLVSVFSTTKCPLGSEAHPGDGFPLRSSYQNELQNSNFHTDWKLMSPFAGVPSRVGPPTSSERASRHRADRRGSQDGATCRSVHGFDNRFHLGF